MSFMANHDDRSNTPPGPPVPNRGEPARERILRRGKLMYGGFSPAVIDCLIVDASAGGVCVETPSMTVVPEQLRLRIGDGPERPVRRCWAQGNLIGVAFLD
jgi:hypothetical protein